METTMVLKIADVKTPVQGLGDQEWVLLPLVKYNTILDKLEDLADLKVMLEAMRAAPSEAMDYEEYRARRLGRVHGQAA